MSFMATRLVDNFLTTDGGTGFGARSVEWNVFPRRPDRISQVK